MIKSREMKALLSEKKLNDAFSVVYRESAYDRQYERFTDVLSYFTELFDKDEEREVMLLSAPGRSEICGNHTDHNFGLVLAAGISLDAIAVASKTDNGIIHIKSVGHDMDVVDCSDLEVKPEEEGKSQSIVRGIVARFVQLGYKVGGFDAATASQVLSGSGLSSSAAFEVLVCAMLNHLYNDGKIDPVEIAQISQYSENVYFGKPCGLLDQMACSVGGFVNIDFADPSKPVIKKIDFDFGKYGYNLCIVDTKGSHSDLTDEYAAVRGEMEAVAAYLGKKVLREVTLDDVIANAKAISAELGERAVLRAIHYFGENRRVGELITCLEEGNIDSFLDIIKESGRSSYMYNQNVFTCKAPKNQPLSLALCLSEEILGKGNAWRVHGGGFAGTIQAFVKDDILDKYTDSMKALFGDDCCYVLSIRPYGGVKLA